MAIYRDLKERKEMMSAAEYQVRPILVMFLRLAQDSTLIVRPGTSRSRLWRRKDWNRMQTWKRPSRPSRARSSGRTRVTARRTMRSVWHHIYREQRLYG